MAKGIDIGTHMLVSAVKGDDGKVNYSEQIDAFFTLDATEESKSLLDMLQIPYIEKKKTISVIGLPARNFANMFQKETRRPLQQGCLNKKDMDAFGMLQVIIGEVLGKPSKENELLKYSVTSTPLGTEMDFTYHKSQMEAIMKGLGYNPEPVQEARAVALSELAADKFTGLAISCLLPGSLIYSSDGLVNIENVKSGQLFLDKNGNYNECISPTNREYDGTVYQLIHDGIGEDPRICPFFTGNHEIWIKRKGKWQYISAENVKTGDVVGEKIPSWNSNHEESREYLSLYHNTTGMKSLADKKMIYNSQAVARFLGYFLGDGYLQQDETRIRIDFGKNELKYVEDLKIISEEIFDSKFKYYDYDGRYRCDISNPGLHKWLKKCYDSNGEKNLPWNIQNFNQNQLIGLVQGLVRSDGWETDCGIGFENTSSALTVMLRQALHMLGIPTTLDLREPREGGFVDDGTRQIIGKKLIYSIRASQPLKFNGLKKYLDSNENANLRGGLWIEDGFLCSRVRKINTKLYTGKVYDIIMGDEHSFTVPGITVHNCGAGTTTVYLGHYGVDNPKLQFSIDKGGDWIDKYAAEMFAGLTQTKVQTVKEKGFSIKDPNKGLDVENLEGAKQLEARAREALAAYYKAYINNVFKLIEKKFNEESVPEFGGPIKCVVAGGTSLAGDFLESCKDIIGTLSLPFEISEVIHAKDPTHAVAKGCLIAAELEDRKKNKV